MHDILQATKEHSNCDTYLHSYILFFTWKIYVIQTKERKAYILSWEMNNKQF